MIILQALLEKVENLLDSRLFPGVEAQRPASCPLCGQLAFSPGERLGIVGHGTYRRQVLGVVEATREAVTRVRRYFCRGCRRTISVLSDHLHPRRWYAARAILEALWLHLVEERSEAEIREALGVELDSPNWRSLRRWRRQLLLTLWYWLRKRLGARGPATTRGEGRRRLERLFAQSPAAPDAALLAPRLGGSTAHFQAISWPLGHDPPEDLKRKLLSL